MWEAKISRDASQLLENGLPECLNHSVRLFNQLRIVGFRRVEIFVSPLLFDLKRDIDRCSCFEIC